jgi:hypothetical protein
MGTNYEEVTTLFEGSILSSAWKKLGKPQSKQKYNLLECDAMYQHLGGKGCLNFQGQI